MPGRGALIWIKPSGNRADQGCRARLLDNGVNSRYRLCGLIPPKTTYRHGFLGSLCATACSLMLPTSAFAHGTDHELIEAASREIAAHPDEASRYLRRAFLQLEHGDWKACVLDVQEAERRQPPGLEAGLLRSRALATGGLLVEAKAALDPLVAAYPESAAARWQRARVLGALGQPVEAAEEFGRALALVPEPEPEQVFEFVDLLSRANRRADALAAIDQALGRMSGLQSLVDRAVEIELALGRPDAALRRMDAVIAAANMKEPLLAKRASLLARAGRTQESLAEWRELQKRIVALPLLERGTAAMSRLLEQAHRAAESLANLPPP